VSGISKIQNQLWTCNLATATEVATENLYHQSLRKFEMLLDTFVHLFHNFMKNYDNIVYLFYLLIIVYFNEPCVLIAFHNLYYVLLQILNNLFHTSDITPPIFSPNRISFSWIEPKSTITAFDYLKNFLGTIWFAKLFKCRFTEATITEVLKLKSTSSKRCI
jgi:hypothetical protein